MSIQKLTNIGDGLTALTEMVNADQSAVVEVLAVGNKTVSFLDHESEIHVYRDSEQLTGWVMGAKFTVTLDGEKEELIFTPLAVTKKKKTTVPRRRGCSVIPISPIRDRKD